MRRALRERSIGHTGTLDPLASGLLPLVVGKATRLASLLTGGDKTYEATIRLGYATSTDDSAGARLPLPAGQIPSDVDIAAALDRFRGPLLQLPPQYSAKKIDGEKAYDRARQARPLELEPVEVTVRELEYLGRENEDVTIRVRATAGFYVRSLARDLGANLGCGGHIASLRRVASGWFRLDQAMTLDEAERMGEGAASRLLAPSEALPELPFVRVNDVGLRRVMHGNELEPVHLEGGFAALIAVSGGVGHTAPRPESVKVLGPDGRLLALARMRRGTLHPVVVLG
jgi:tRNA pseudouridine55 synthase